MVDCFIVIVIFNFCGGICGIGGVVISTCINWTVWYVVRCCQGLGSWELVSSINVIGVGLIVVGGIVVIIFIIVTFVTKLQFGKYLSYQQPMELVPKPIMAFHVGILTTIEPTMTVAIINGDPLPLEHLRPAPF